MAEPTCVFKRTLQSSAALHEQLLSMTVTTRKIMQCIASCQLSCCMLCWAWLRSGRIHLPARAPAGKVQVQQPTPARPAAFQPSPIEPLPDPATHVQEHGHAASADPQPFHIQAMPMSDPRTARCTHHTAGSGAPPRCDSHRSTDSGERAILYLYKSSGRHTEVLPGTVLHIE